MKVIFSLWSASGGYDSLRLTLRAKCRSVPRFRPRFTGVRLRISINNISIFKIHNIYKIFRLAGIYECSHDVMNSSDMLIVRCEYVTPVTTEPSFGSCANQVRP